MLRITLLLFVLINFGNYKIMGQLPNLPKPQKIKKTESNKNNKCFLALFEIQDADDYLEQIKSSRDIKEVKRLLELIKECFDDNDMYILLCPCIIKQQEAIWIMTDEPELKIEEAIKTNDLTKIRKLVDEVSDDIFYILLFYNKCI